MKKKRGKFIVIDGTDGSGKATQVKILAEQLKKSGYKIVIVDFPQYNQKSAGMVEEYLSGKYGSVENVNPYQASVFYAVDRFDASFKIGQQLAEGKIVLSNRYVSANMGHQGSKFTSKIKRKRYFKWLYDFEYNLFKIPKPDLSLILHVEPEISQKLCTKRNKKEWIGKKRDIHEENLNHLKKAEKVYLEIADTFPCFKLIKCTENNSILSKKEISEKILKEVKKIL